VLPGGAGDKSNLKPEFAVPGAKVVMAVVEALAVVQVVPAVGTVNTCCTTTPELVEDIAVVEANCAVVVAVKNPAGALPREDGLDEEEPTEAVLKDEPVIAVPVIAPVEVRPPLVVTTPEELTENWSEVPPKSPFTNLTGKSSTVPPNFLEDSLWKAKYPIPNPTTRIPR
jgi:hypothetical protein